MSWDSYRDNLLQSGNVKKVAIVGAQDGAVWTVSPGFQVSTQEAMTIANGFKNADVLRANGVVVGTEKHFYIQSDDKQIQGKKGPGGVSIAKSNLCIIIATYDESIQPGACRKTVEDMCDFLTSNNY